MDINSIKERLNSLQTSSGKKEKVDYSKYYWKPKQEGKYNIRIVPSIIDKSCPFQEVFIHYGYTKFPIYALTNWGEKDPIVEFAKKLRSGNDKEHWKLAKKLDPKMRIFAPVIVRGEEDKGVRLWEFGKEIYMQLLSLAEDEDYGDFTDVNEGRDFVLEAIMGDIGGRQGLKSSIRAKPKVSPLSTDKNITKSWLEEQPKVLELQRKMEWDDLKKILQDFLNPEEEAETTGTTEETVEDQITDEGNDLPWTTDEEKPKSGVKAPVKSSNIDKFNSLFEEED